MPLPQVWYCLWLKIGDIVQNMKKNKPAINIYYSSKIDKNHKKIRVLLNGIEEEGIPYKLISEDETDILTLSYEACNSSILGVGLGINNEEIVLHYNKLHKSQPLFKVKLTSDNSEIRVLGSNGARLVKKMPFKQL